MAINKISDIFVLIDSDHHDSFIKKYLTGTPAQGTKGQEGYVAAVARSTAYDSKVCFLQKTQELFTQGQLYGLNNAADVQALGTLIGTLPNKTEAVLYTYEEYTALDGKGETTAEQFAALSDAEKTKTAATEYTSVVEYIKETAKDAVASGVSVDTTQFQISSTAKYQLAQDETGKISIVRYDPITLNISGLSPVEIDSTVDATTITPSVGGSNKATATVTWSVTGGTLDKTSTTGSSTVSVSGITSPTSCTVKASATDGPSTVSNKTTTLTFLPRVMWGWSADELTNVEITSTNVSGYDYLVQSSRSLGSTGKSLTIGDGGGYIYYAAPESYQVATNKMFVNSGTAKAPLGGGWIEVGEFTKYTSKETTYKLYRTTNKQAAGTYRIDVD